MSTIACTSRCIYQKDGWCRLERAAPRGEIKAGGKEPCIHFVEDLQKGSAAESDF